MNNNVVNINDLNKKNSITVDSFVKSLDDKNGALSSATSRKAIVEKIIRRKYCPILEKRAALQVSFNRAILKENDVEYYDEFLGHMSLFGAVIALYTVLEFEKDKDGVPKVYEAYDALKKKGLIDDIYKVIGDAEMNELRDIYDMIKRTFNDKNSSVKMYVNKQISRILTGMGDILDKQSTKLKEFLNDNENAQIITGAITGAANKAVDALSAVMEKVQK